MTRHDKSLATALAHLQAGRLDKAARLYRQVLALQPRQADALHLLGVIAQRQGDLNGAAELIGQAIAVKPDYFAAQFNLGNIWFQIGRLDAAATCYARALAIEPNAAMAHVNLGNTWRALGQLDKAVDSFRQAASLGPDDAALYNDLGVMLDRLGRDDDAAECYRRAIALQPLMPEIHNNLGNLFLRQGSIDEAIASYGQALRLNPDHAEALSNLGNAWLRQGDSAAALANYERAILINPKSARALNNRGNLLCELGRMSEAEPSLRAALALEPNDAEIANNLGALLLQQARVVEALELFQCATTLQPDFAGAASNLLLALNYLPDISPSQIFDEHKRFGERFALAGKGKVNPSPAGGRRLKIGYVSPDFREHSCAYFLEPLLAAHNRDQIELYCYSDVKRPDAVTARLRGLGHNWRAIADRPDRAVAEQVRSDGIDILVDCAGHSADNRLTMFAMRPAPIQVSWLGYANTTGLTAIDYRLTDALADPPGADAFHTEKLVRLENGFLCYQLPEGAPAVTILPALRQGHVTFGSFNHLAKVNDAVIALWAKLLRHVPASRLMLKSRPLADAATRQRLIEAFATNGIAANRLDLMARTPSSVDHLCLYGLVDIALDPFPYNGTTTTLEAMSMGVPVVTLVGERHAGRVGASLLTHAGRTDLVAGTPDEYLEIAADLTSDLLGLAARRAALRQDLASSPLGNARDFANRVEVAFRQMIETAGRRLDEKIEQRN